MVQTNQEKIYMKNIQEENKMTWDNVTVIYHKRKYIGEKEAKDLIGWERKRII